MYDFIDFSQGTNFYLNLYCFLLYCVLLFISLRGNVTNLYVQESYKGRTLLLAGGLLLFALSSFIGADFFHCYENMAEYKNQAFGDQEIGLEAFYQYLIYYTNGNYFLFRLVVWGGSLALIISAARKFGVDIYNTLFVVLAGFVIIYSYARATLAMSVFFMGVVTICSSVDSKKKFLQIIIGIAVLASSIYFHRSMLPMMAVALLWLLLPGKKKLSKYSLWLFPVVVLIFSIVLKMAFEEMLAIANAVEDETGTFSKAELYSEQEAAETNANGYIRLVLQYSTFYLPMLLISNAMRSDKVLQIVDNKAIWLYQMTYIIFAFATSFLLLDMDSTTMFYRYLFMSFIPLSILIVYMKNIGVLAIKQYYWIIAIFIASNFLQMFVDVYAQTKA
ncbi:MAG: hypothetical protein IKU93_05570 [Alistipes sp.]|nr:hypothetical protein [Alistipes sp.]